jgi:hypothetical protein
MSITLPLFALPRLADFGTMLASLSLNLNAPSSNELRVQPLGSAPSTLSCQIMSESKNPNMPINQKKGLALNGLSPAIDLGFPGRKFYSKANANS